MFTNVFALTDPAGKRTQTDHATFWSATQTTHLSAQFSKMPRYWTNWLTDWINYTPKSLSLEIWQIGLRRGEYRVSNADGIVDWIEVKTVQSLCGQLSGFVN